MEEFLLVFAMPYMAHLKNIEVLKLAEFECWIISESAKIQALIEARILRIELHCHFGDVKNLGDGLSELRWKNGLRVYFVRISKKTILLLYGGGKNDQKNDIKKAKILLNRCTNP